MSLPSDGSTDLHLPALKLLDVSGNLLILLVHTPIL